MFVDDQELIETVLDDTIDMEDRVYSLQVLESRKLGFTPLVLSSHVEAFVESHK